jgi:dTDP-4-dehydrorhamnose reductase
VVYVSTDYVFDGTSPEPYTEWDIPNPLSVYGRSKLGGEQELYTGSTIVRTSWVNGASGSNMVKTLMRLAASDGVVRFVDDQRGCPTFTADLAGVLAVLATDRLPGIFHVTNQGPTTWFELARAVFAAMEADPERVEPVPTEDLVPPRPAKRPANSVLANVALGAVGMPPMPEWHDALERLLRVLGTEVKA